MESSRVNQVRAERFPAPDLLTLGCKMMEGANLSDSTGLFGAAL